MSQQRLVQLSAASLALVFGMDEESSRTGLYNASGQDIFADFKAQNVRSFWNKRLVKAIAEIYFQGWMENLVLFVQGNANHLEVLREAWMRRALRSPKGFVIKAVGDLSPVQMLPVPQSQFIPLAEVLCSVISDMNASHVTVNQEALINHMSKAHPGMTIPTQDILYNALGTLIKERKIYHTGEGYFIVTPQTYFITDSLVREKSWWTSGPGVNDMPSPPPITYLLSNEACLEANAQPPLVAHCKSCSCFAPQPSSSTAPPTATAATPSNPDQNSVSVSVSDCTGKSLKWTRPSDHKPSVQNQSTSTAADYQASEVSKTTGTTAATSRKDKDYKDKPGRKFGLSLFRRNGGKRDKPKKEYASFSAQFPPEEWPVRDEDDLNNLPRDLEHAIIRRINPELTVDNLTRHTVLMKKLEERGERATVERERPADKGVDRGDRAVDKGMSTEILNSSKAKHHYSSRTGLGAGRRSVPKACRSKRRAHSSREKQRERDRERDKGKRKVPQCVNDDPEAEDLIPSHRRLEVPLNEPDPVGDAGEGRCLYKKRIDNPFQSTPGLDSAPTITTTNPCNRDQKREREPKEGKTRTGRTERGGHRSKSWDPHRARMTPAEAEHTGKSPVSEDRSYERLPECGFPADPLLRPSPKPDRELPADYGSAYPQSSTLRIEDKVKHQREGKNRGRESREGWERGEGKHQMLQEEEVRGRTNQRHPISQAQGEDHPDVPQPNTDMNPSLPATPYDVVSTHSYDPAWAKPSVQQRLSQRYADLEEANNRLPSYQKPCTTAGNQGTYNDSRSPKSSSTEERQITESHVFIGQRDGDHRRPYQRREEEEDACSSLCLSEEGGMNGRKVFKTGKVDCHDLLSVYQDHDPDPQPLELPGHYQPSRHQPDSYFSYNHPHSLRRNWDSTYAMDSHSSTQQNAPQTSVRPEENSWSGGPIYHPQKTQSPDAKSNLNPRRAAPSLGESMHDASLSSDHPDHTEAADSSIFDYCQTSEVDSDAETLHKSSDEGDGESVHWGGEAKEPEESFETQRERDIPQSPGASLNVVGGAQGGEAGETEAERERGESQSVTGDSGIDSPRTRVSLSSNNTVILEGLKRRGFLQNLEKLHSKSTAMRPQSSLLQLTPVMNV